MFFYIAIVLICIIIVSYFLVIFFENRENSNDDDKEFLEYCLKQYSKDSNIRDPEWKEYDEQNRVIRSEELHDSPHFYMYLENGEQVEIVEKEFNKRYNRIPEEHSYLDLTFEEIDEM